VGVTGHFASAAAAADRKVATKMELRSGNSNWECTKLIVGREPERRGEDGLWEREARGRVLKSMNESTNTRMRGKSEERTTRLGERKTRTCK